LLSGLRSFISYKIASSETKTMRKIFSYNNCFLLEYWYLLSQQVKEFEFYSEWVGCFLETFTQEGQVQFIFNQEKYDCSMMNRR
jgi:hypothetical protein